MTKIPSEIEKRMIQYRARLIDERKHDDYISLTYELSSRKATREIAGSAEIMSYCKYGAFIYGGFQYARITLFVKNEYLTPVASSATV